MSKKSQISIFILIAIFILFLMIFLIFTNISLKKGDIGKDETRINSDGKDRINYLKNTVDSCLDLSLKRATIISGLRGGFIYDKGEYYFKGIIPTDTYNRNLISSLDLNWNNLQSRVLVHSQTQAYFPPLINYSNSIYNHSIKDDFEKFITYEFFKCINFEEYNSIYDFEYNDFIGEIISDDINTGEFIIGNFNASIGDIIEIDYIEGFLIGNVTSKFDEYFVVEAFNKTEMARVMSTITPEVRINMSAININTSFEIDVIFNKEDISAQIFFPVRISNKEFSSYYDKSKVTLNVRYEVILNDFVKKLLSHKYAFNKSIDYQHSENIISVLNSSHYFNYLSSDERDEKLEFRIRYLLDDAEHKQYIYSIIDSDSKILGKPFVFNFAYENIAPYINFSNLEDTGLNMDFFENSVVFFASENQPVIYDLWDMSYDEQVYDNWIFYFIEQEKNRLDSNFKLEKNGTLTFLAKQKKLYTYDVEVTDGETIRTYNVIFVTGFPDNTNNQIFSDCIRFKNFEHPFFPIEDDFKDKIFYNVDENGYNHASAFELNIPTTSVVSVSSTNLTLKRHCSVPISRFPVKFEIDGIFREQKTFDPNGGDLHFEIPQTNQKVTAKITIVNLDGSPMVEPFVIDIYPANCLGPHPMNINGIDGTLSCCNTQIINDSISSNSYSNFYSNILNGNVVLENEKISFFLDPKGGDGFDFTQDNIWISLGSSATSLYESTANARCKGIYPGFLNNLEFIGSSNLGTIAKSEFNFDSVYQYSDLDLGINLMASVQTPTSTCEFAYITNDEKLLFGFDTQNGLKYVGGFSDLLNPEEIGVSPIPEGSDNSDLFVLCDDTVYVGSGDGNWFTSNFGKDIKSRIYVSSGYCNQGDTGCSPRAQRGSDSPILYRNDVSTNGCTDIYYNYFLREFEYNDNNILCNSGQVCSSGSCVPITP